MCVCLHKKMRDRSACHSFWLVFKCSLHFPYIRRLIVVWSLFTVESLLSLDRGFAVGCLIQRPGGGVGREASVVGGSRGSLGLWQEVRDGVGSVTGFSVGFGPITLAK